jgi:ketosteroid isomerase-like protein
MGSRSTGDKDSKGTSMTDDQRKQRAKELLHAAEQGDAAAVDAMISDDFTFKSMRRAPIILPTGEPMPTDFDREAFLSFVGDVPTFTKDGLHFTYDLALSDGDYVAVFGESNATALSGKKYANVYSWLFHFADGKVTHWREYCDTHLVCTVLFG